MRSIIAVLCLTASSAFAVNGAVLQSVTLDHNVATAHVINQSTKDITGFSVAFRATYGDGQVEPSVHTRDYGPLTGEVLAANKTTEMKEEYGAEPLSVEAIVVVAIYKDGTAEADDATVLDKTIATRRGIAKALRLSASTLNASLEDAHPSDYARTKLTLARDDKSVNTAFINGSLEVIEIAANNGHEREFLQEHAARYEKEAAAFEAYSNIRRVQ